MALAQDEQWKEVQKMRIAEAFALFDKEKKGILPKDPSDRACCIFKYSTGK